MQSVRHESGRSSVRWCSGPHVDWSQMVRRGRFDAGSVVQLRPGGDYPLRTEMLRGRDVNLYGFCFASTSALNYVLSPGIVAITVPIRRVGELRQNGAPFGPHSIYVQGGSNHQYIIGPPREDFGVGVTRNRLMDVTAALAGVDPDDIRLADDMLDVPATELATLRQVIQRHLQQGPALNGTWSSRLRFRMDDDVLNALGLALLAAWPGKQSTRDKVRPPKAIVHRAIEAQEAAGEAPLPLDRLCAAAGVGSSTLNSAFREVCGVPPLRYFRIRRLNAARRLLLRSSDRRGAVKRIALELGITEFGRFSVDYQKVFGELPSETLARGKPDEPSSRWGSDVSAFRTHLRV